MIMAPTISQVKGERHGGGGRGREKEGTAKRRRIPFLLQIYVKQLVCYSLSGKNVS